MGEMLAVVLNLYNLTTGEINELTTVNRRPIAHNEMVLLSHEDPQAILDLQTAWEKEFPGKSQSHITQREILLRSDWHRRRLAVAFEELQLDLAFTGLPMQYWGPQILKRFDGLHRTSARAERHFTQSFKAMQAATSAEKNSDGKLTKNNPPEPVIETIGTYTYQRVAVKVVNGKTVTKVDLDAEHWLTLPASHVAVAYCRQFRFENCFVPSEYAYVLAHDGIAHPTARAFFLYYSIEEFLRLCQLEKDTGSEHLLDQGIRIKTERLV